jgi:hypothetical protein
MVTLHVPVPLHSPDQPANAEPDAGAAVSVTTVSLANDAWHVLPQLIPAGAEVTVPAPIPALVTESVRATAKAAVTDMSSVMTTWHAPVPEHAPPHPVKTKPDAAVADSTTSEPVVKLASHVGGQLIPEGLDATVPEPVTVTVRRRVALCAAASVGQDERTESAMHIKSARERIVFPRSSMPETEDAECRACRHPPDGGYCAS